MADNDNLYRPPSAPLAQEEMPQQFLTGNVKSKTFSRAGWLTILYLLLSIPTLYLSVLRGMSPGEVQPLITLSLTVVLTALWIYMLLALKGLLNVRLDYSGANRLIQISIWLSVAVLVPEFFADSEPADPTNYGVATMVTVVLLIPSGIVTFMLGKRLLSIKIHYKWIGLFAWMMMISGVLMASVILILLFIPFTLIAVIALAAMFFTAARELRAHEANA